MCFLRFVKKLSAILAVTLGILGVFGLSSTPAFASPAELKEDLGAPVINSPTLMDSDPYLLAGTAGSISNGYGELECYMTSGCYWPTIQASTGYNNGVTGTVQCFVEFPNGTIHQLGFIPASNGSTPRVDFYYCPYGYYKFIFEANVSDELDVAGFIYDE